MHIDREKLRELDKEEEQKIEQEVVEESTASFKPALSPATEFVDKTFWNDSFKQENVQEKPAEDDKAEEEKPEAVKAEEEKPSDAVPAEEFISEPKETETETKEKLPKKKKFPAKYILLIIACIILLAAAGFKIYMDAAHKPKTPASELIPANLNVEISDNMLVVRNPQPVMEMEKAGIIFYSELRVDGQCYLPLMIALANMGYDCFLPVASGNQPYLNIEGADSVVRKYEDIENWILVGHGSACTPAAMYANQNAEGLKGLIFLGGYSDSDISGTGIPVLSLIGTKDTTMNPEKLEASKKNLPETAESVSIDGANHTGFVDTNLLRGDSDADISFEDQILRTSTEIDRFARKILP